MLIFGIWKRDCISSDICQEELPSFFLQNSKFSTFVSHSHHHLICKQISLLFFYLFLFQLWCTKMVFIKETCSTRSVDPLYIFLFLFGWHCIECGHQILLALYSYSLLFLIWNVLLPHLPTYSYLAIKCWEQWQLLSWTPSMYECINNHLTCEYLDNHLASQRHWCHRF